MSNTPGADQLQALITFSNQTTGGSDTKISDAVATLASGYGSGSSTVITSTASSLDVILSGNTEITEIHAPDAQAYAYAFRGCTSLEKVVMGEMKKIAGVCYSCTSLTHADLTTTTQVGQLCFYGCSSLYTIVIRGSSYAGLENYNGVSGSPFENKDPGTVLYVPSNLISTYQNGAWGNCAETITAIEGSQYENYYVDGKAIS